MNTNVRLINDLLLEDLQHKAVSSDRFRSHFNIHSSLDDPVQRFVVALDPQTFVRPHRHSGEHKWEILALINGSCAVVIFDINGKIQDRWTISSDGPNYAIEIPGDTWHTLSCLEPGTVMLELKQGPYTPLSVKDFASWAPQEGEKTCVNFNHWFRSGRIGSYYTD